MPGENVSLLYTGTFDGSGVIAGLEETDKAFQNTEKVAKQSFEGASAEVEKHRRVFGLAHREIRRTLTEGMVATQLSTDVMREGFTSARGAMEGLNLAAVAFTSGGAAGGLMIFAAAVSLVAENIKKSKEAARETSWYEDPEEIEKTVSAMDDYDKKIKQVTESQIKQTQVITGMNTYNAEIATADAAMQKLHGTSEANYEAAHGGAVKARALLEAQMNAAKDYQKELETINDLEAKKSLIQAQGAFGIAQAGNNPIAKQKAEGAARVAEAKNAQDLLIAQQREYGDKRILIEAKLATDIDEKAKKTAEKELSDVTLKYNRVVQEIDVGTQREGLVEKTAAINNANEIRKIHEEEQAKADAASQEATNKYEQFRRKERQIQQRDIDEAKRMKEEEIKWRAELDKQMRDTALASGQGGKTPDQVAMEDEIEAFKTSNAAKVASTEQTEQIISNIKEKYALKEKQFKLQQSSELIGASEAFVTTIMGHNKTLFLASKALAAADIVVKTMQAYAANSLLGPAAYAADVLTSIRMGMELATVAATTIQGFAAGGMVDGRDRIIRVNESGQEAVLNPTGVAAAGGADGVASLNSGRGGGGNVHFGDTYVTISGDVSPARAREIGESIAQSKRDRLIQLKSDIQDIPYLRIPDMRS